METIATMLTHLTDPESIMRNLKETLRIMDPEYPQEEQKFLHAAAALEQTAAGPDGPTAREYLAARDAAISAGMVFVLFQGIQLNLDIFRQPVNALLLKEDYGVMHRESLLRTVPAVQKMRETQDAFSAARKPQQWIMEDITAYYAYLETVGYKLAHYFGFRLADRFLPYVVPGYYSDGENSARYAGELGQYLQMDLNRLEA